MRLVRRPDWRASLHQFLASVARAEFRPGKLDCCLFAAGAVAAMTDTDLAAEFRGRYRTFRTGKRLVGGDHIAFAASLLPSRESVLLARPGDVAIVGDALGVVLGEDIAVLHPLRGYGLVPLTQAQGALAV